MYLNFDSKLGKFAKSSGNSKAATCGSAATSRNNDMQSIDLSGNFDENADRATFGNSSMCRNLDQEKDSLRQVAELSQTLADLKNAIQAKDFQIESIRRDNERLASELKRQQRRNRNLKQQLDDERFFYEKEKEHFSEEMLNREAKCTGGVTKAQQLQRRESERIRESLEDENKQLRDEILDKSEVTYNLCIKFLRMKDARDSLRRKLDRLLQEHLRAMAETMEKLDEAREELNIIVSEKFQEPLSISKAKFLQVVQRNSRLVYENSTLKLHIQQLTQSIEKLKGSAQRAKTIDVDARTIEKLSECSRRRRSEEATRTSASLRNLEKFPSASKSSGTANTPMVERLGEGKMISAIKRKHRGKPTVVDYRQSEATASPKLPTERTLSAPEIVQTATFRQAQFSDTPMNRTDFTERSLEFRDAGTNT